MEEKQEAKTIQLSEYRKGQFELDNKNIIIQNIITNEDSVIIDKDNNNNEEIWLSISNRYLEDIANNKINDYKARTGLIDTIVNKSLEKNANGVIIDFSNVQQKENFKRFMIELAPKLRELGISTSLVLKDNLEKADYINIVDYVIE